MLFFSLSFHKSSKNFVIQHIHRQNMVNISYSSSWLSLDRQGQAITHDSSTRNTVADESSYRKYLGDI